MEKEGIVYSFLWRGADASSVSEVVSCSEAMPYVHVQLLHLRQLRRINHWQELHQNVTTCNNHSPFFNNSSPLTLTLTLTPSTGLILHTGHRSQDTGHRTQYTQATGHPTAPPHDTTRNQNNPNLTLIQRLVLSQTHLISLTFLFTSPTPFLFLHTYTHIYR